MMRKNFFGVIIIGILYATTFLAGCSLFNVFDKSYYYKYEELNDGLTGIEIVYISPMSDFTDMIILEALEENEISECLHSICEIKFSTPFGTPTTPTEYCIKINYSEDYLLLGRSAGLTLRNGYYSYEGAPLEGELLLELISKYTILEYDI